MNQLYPLCRELTNLSEVQIRILDHMQDATQFAADISKSQVIVCAKGKNEHMIAILFAAKPAYQGGQTYFNSGDMYFDDEFTLVENVFDTGRKVVGRKELDLGRMTAITAFPIEDNAGIPFAVAVFASPSLKQQQILTDTAFMAMQVPLEDAEYRSLRPQDGMIVLDSVGRIIYANDMADDLYFVLDKEAVERREIIGHSMVRFPLVDKIMETRRPAYGDEISGNMTISAWGIPIMSGGRVARTVLLLTDVTAVREKERQILVKDSVIKEIHHRVKNSLNTIAGMLRMQARRAKDPDTKEALKKSIDRILGISQVHDILANQSGDKIDWNLLLDKICRLSIDSLAVCPVELVRMKSGEPILVNSEKAVPLAIAANELIHNAIGHGFDGLPAGKLIVGARVEEKELHVFIKNNGHALPDSFGSKKFDLGLQIVRTLSEIELEGSFILQNENDMVAAHIRCPLSVMEAE